MRLKALLATVFNSEPSDWVPVEGPVGMQHLGEVTELGVDKIEVVGHHSLWIYEPDVHLSLAFGFPHRSSNFEYPRWPQFAEPKLTPYYVDVCFSGSPVHRDVLVSVDGGRAFMPDFKNEVAPSGARFGMEAFALSATSAQVSLARLVSVLQGTNEFDRYWETIGAVEIPPDGA